MRTDHWLSSLARIASCLCVLGAPNLYADDPWVTYEPVAGAGVGKYIVFVSGDEEYRSEEACPMLAKILARRHGFKTTVLFAVDRETGNIDPWERTNIPGLHLLAEADAMVIFTRFRELPDESMVHLAKFIESGKGIVGIRPTIAGFRYERDKESPFAKWSFRSRTWPGGFGKQVLGETWVAHHGAHKRESTRGIVEPAASDHVILRGVDDVWAPSDVYAIRSLPEDARVLLRGQVVAGLKSTDPPVAGKKNEAMMPVAWTRRYTGESGKTSRVFYTSMGASVDFENEGLRRLFVNACYWATGLDDRVPAKANVDYVDEYRPSFFSLAPRPRPLPIKPSDHRLGARARARRFELRPGDRVAFIGNSLAERMNLYGHLESLLHGRFPKHELVVRNFGWPGDEVGVRRRPNGYTTIDDPFLVFGADVLLCFFGFNESFAGPAGLEKFEADAERLVAELEKKLEKDGQAPRVVLVSPIAFEDTGDPLLPNGAELQTNLEAYSRSMEALASRLSLPFVDLFTPSRKLFDSEKEKRFTIDGAHLDERGDRAIAEMLDRALFGSPNPIGPPYTSRLDRLRAAVVDKAFVHSSDYRMVNGWYVYGNRRKPYDVRTFPEEFAKLRNMAAVRDRRLWRIAQGQPVRQEVDDSGTGDLTPVASGFGKKRYSEPEKLRYLTPGEALAAFTVANGYEVGLFASEDRFPELANPNQIGFDGQGRLWALCLPTYPQWRPGDARPDDRLLIFEDANADGVADEVKVFAGDLHAPLGFEFWDGGVFVAQPPKLLYLKDTDGDDVADTREVVLDGFGSEDTHVGITALEWTPRGELLLLEGIAKSTTVETLYGPVRTRSPTVYRYDPRTRRLAAYCPSPHPNPWGYVHDRWGQGFLCDGTTGAQFWTTPLAGASSGGRKGYDEILKYSGTRLRPAIGCEFISSRHFPDKAQGNYLFACVINLNGIPQFRVRDDGAGFVAERIEDLVFSSDRNFRPVDPQFGPDGALWFGDWHTPLIGHMQYSQRDPNRDHAHGRIFRLTARGRPLLVPALQAGRRASELLEQLEAPEDRTRYRARRALRDRGANEVLPALRKWVEGLDASDPDYEHHLVEALWVGESLRSESGDRAVDSERLGRLLRAKDPRAREAATRVLADLRPRRAETVALLRERIADEHPRVRLEALRGLSFFSTMEAVEGALEVTKQPLDSFLEYTLARTLESLKPVWKPALSRGVRIAAKNPKGAQYLRYHDAGRKVSKQVRGRFEALLAGGLETKARERAISELSRAKGVASEGKRIFGRVCASCHRVGGEGVEFGPDLSKVGSRLPRKDLVLSVFEPNADVDPKYRVVNILTLAGAVYTGYLDSETDESLDLRGAGGAVTEIRKSDIASRETLEVSGMADGLAVSLSPLEFVDLIEFLATLK